MSCPVVIRVTTQTGPPGIGLPEGSADAGKIVQKDGSTPYLYKLVTPGAASLPQALDVAASPIFVGLTLSGIPASRLLFTGTGGSLSGVGLGANLSISGGNLVASGGATDLSYDPATRLLASSTGADVTLPLADATNPGLLTAAEKALIASALQAGQAFPLIEDIRNNSGATLAIGTPVYVTGSSGTKPTVAAASASSELTAARSFGVMWNTTANNADGKVITRGILPGFNTSTLTEGGVVWLSLVTGQLTSTRPTQPAHSVFFGFCIKQGAGTSGILYVNVINGQELEELHDVLITGLPPAVGAPRPALVRASDGLWRDTLLTPADVGAATAAQGALANTAVQPAALAGYQPVDSDLTAIAALTTTTYGRAFLALADDAAGRTALGLGTLATQSGTFSGTSSGTNTGDQTITLTGDVTGSGTGSFTATLASTTVTAGSYSFGSFTVDAKGRITAASAGSVFTSSAAGLVPASGGGTTTFLRADGTFAAPPGGGSGSPGGTSGQAQYNLSGAFAGAAGLTFDGSGNINLGVFTDRLRIPLSVSASTAAGHVYLDGTDGLLRFRDNNNTERRAMIADRFNPGYATGAWIGPPMNAAPTAATASLQSLRFSWSTYIAETRTFQIAVRSASTFSGSTTFRLCVFSNANARPLSVVFDSGDITATASSTNYVSSTTVTLQPGFYHLGFLATAISGTAAFQGTSTSVRSAGTNYGEFSSTTTVVNLIVLPSQTSIPTTIDPAGLSVFNTGGVVPFLIPQ